MEERFPSEFPRWTEKSWPFWCLASAKVRSFWSYDNAGIEEVMRGLELGVNE